MHLGNIEDWGKRIKRNIVNNKKRERERERAEGGSTIAKLLFKKVVG